MSVRKDEYVIKGFTFTYYMMMAIVASYFPLYFDYLGYSKTQIGMLYAIGPMVGIFSNITWGYLSDKFQTVKKVMIILFIAQLFLVFIMFQADTFTLLYVLVACFFFFQQPVMALNDSQLLLQVNISKKTYASFRLWGSLGFAFAALFFGMVTRMFGAGITPLISLITVGLGLILAFMLTDARGNQAQKNKMDMKDIFKVIGSKTFLIFLLIVIVLSVAHRMNDGFLALHMRELGASDSLVGLAWMASALSEIPMFLFLSKFGHRYKELPLLAFAGFAYALRYCLMSLVSNPIWVLVLQMMHSITFGIFLVTAIRYIQQIVPDQYRSSGQAMFAVAWSGIAGLISGSVGGAIFDSAGSFTLYRIGALLSLLAAVSFIVMHMQRERQRSIDLDS